MCYMCTHVAHANAMPCHMLCSYCATCVLHVMQALCQQGGKYRCATDRMMQAFMILLLHFLARGYVLKGGQRPSLVCRVL